DKRDPLELDWRKVQNVGTIDVIEDRKPDEVVAISTNKILRVLPEGRWATFAGVFALSAGSPDGEGEGVRLGEKKGDRLELNMEFRFLDANIKDLEIRIGLFNNGGTPSNDHKPAPYSDDVGYWVSLPQRGGVGQAFKELGKDGTIAGGSDKVSLRAAMGKPINPLADTWHTITMELRRENDQIVIQGKLDGVVFATGMDTKKPEDRFDPPGVLNVFQEIGCATAAPAHQGLHIRRVWLKGDHVEVSDSVRSGPEELADSSYGAGNQFPGQTPKSTKKAKQSQSSSNWMLWAVVAGGVALSICSAWITRAVMLKKAAKE
ncbi:MAG TPA: hypothetical protein VK968_03455, partial [Roseimicrobium sp.]|nr:hypothetical protein [Roseimicrobium sp.]